MNKNDVSVLKKRWYDVVKNATNTEDNCKICSPSHYTLTVVVIII